MKRADAGSVEASCVPAATSKELGCAEHVESGKNRKTLIRSQVRIATDYTFNATAIAGIAANLYVKIVNMIRHTCV